MLLWTRKLLEEAMSLTGEVEDAELPERGDALRGDPGEPVVREVQLPQRPLEAVERHRGDLRHRVVAHLEAPHSCNGKKKQEGEI